MVNLFHIQPHTDVCVSLDYAKDVELLDNVQKLSKFLTKLPNILIAMLNTSDINQGEMKIVLVSTRHFVPLRSIIVTLLVSTHVFGT